MELEASAYIETIRQELATVMHRTIIAESTVKQQNRHIDELQNQIGFLQQQIEDFENGQTEEVSDTLE